MKPIPVKRIRVTMDLSIPRDWTIGKTADWLERLLRGCDPEVGEQRFIRNEPEKVGTE